VQGRIARSSGLRKDHERRDEQEPSGQMHRRVDLGPIRRAVQFGAHGDQEHDDMARRPTATSSHRVGGVHRRWLSTIRLSPRATVSQRLIANSGSRTPNAVIGTNSGALPSRTMRTPIHWGIAFTIQRTKQNEADSHGQSGCIDPILLGARHGWKVAGVPQSSRRQATRLDAFEDRQHKYHPGEQSDGDLDIAPHHRGEVAKPNSGAALPDPAAELSRVVSTTTTATTPDRLSRSEEYWIVAGADEVLRTDVVPPGDDSRFADLFEDDGGKRNIGRLCLAVGSFFEFVLDEGAQFPG